METKDFIKLLGEKSQTIMSLVVIVLILTVIITASQTLKYTTKSRIILVQNYNTAGAVDPYVVSKSNEYLSNILSRVTTSEIFFNDILNSGYEIDKTYFGDTVTKQIKIWQKTISSKTLNDTGIIEVEVYHPDKNQSIQIAQAINYILKTKHGNYHGNSENVSIKIIDQPIVSLYPTKPNILINLSFALIFSLMFSLIYITLFPEEKYNIYLWPRTKASKYIEQERKASKDIVYSQANLSRIEFDNPKTEIIENQNYNQEEKRFNNQNRQENLNNQKFNQTERNYNNQYRQNRQENSNRFDYQRRNQNNVIKQGNIANVLD